jgi:predicted transcriptional regulator
MKNKLLEEMTKNPIDPSTLLTVLQTIKDLSPETLEKVLKSIENMSEKDLIELARSLNTLSSEVKQRVMKEIINRLKDLDSKTQAILLQEMLIYSAGVDSELLSDLIVIFSLIIKIKSILITFFLF